jgi:hypothetical protein
LWQAAVLHRSVASKRARARLILRRNMALKAARERGLSLDAMAARLKLQPGTVRELVRNPRREAAKAAGLTSVPPPADGEQLSDAG